MRRSRRLILAAVMLVSAAAAVLILTAFSSAASGPIGTALDRLATAVRSLEHQLRERARAPGRRSRLDWFDPYRREASRLRRPDVVLLGAYANDPTDTLQGVMALERALDTTLPLVQIYTAWGDGPEHRFPVRTATTIWNLGSVPVVTWEPWLTVFEAARHPHLPLPDARDPHGLAAVARGDYDFYVDAWAADAAAFGRPIFVRLAHEMNDPYRYPWGPQHNTKEEFVAAWRRIVDRFRAAGAHNVIWVWSPHVAYEYWELYFPGEAYVDWAATGVLNFGPIAQWSRWWTIADIFGSKHEALAAFGKPVMIAEFGSLAVGGDRAGWYADALTDLPSRYPLVRAVLFFEVTSDRTVTYQAIDWSIRSDPAVLEAVRRATGAWRR
jgi:hypothetical protein